MAQNWDKCVSKSISFTIKMLLNPFKHFMNVILITLIVCEFIYIIECVPISGGETVPEDGEFI